MRLWLKRLFAACVFRGYRSGLDMALAFGVAFGQRLQEFLIVAGAA